MRSKAKYAVRGYLTDGSRLCCGGIVRVPQDIAVEVVSPSRRDDHRDRIEKMDE
jgi:hypothetical protein